MVPAESTSFRASGSEGIANPTDRESVNLGGAGPLSPTIFVELKPQQTGTRLLIGYGEVATTSGSTSLRPLRRRGRRLPRQSSKSAGGPSPCSLRATARQASSAINPSLHHSTNPLPHFFLPGRLTVGHRPLKATMVVRIHPRQPFQMQSAECGFPLQDHNGVTRSSFRSPHSEFRTQNARW